MDVQVFVFSLGVINFFLSFPFLFFFLLFFSPKGLMEEVRVLEREEAREKENRIGRVRFMTCLDPSFYAEQQVPRLEVHGTLRNRQPWNSVSSACEDEIKPCSNCFDWETCTVLSESRVLLSL